MKTHQVEYSLTGLCSCLGVSRSGYYAGLHRKPNQRYQQRLLLDNQVKTLFDLHKQLTVQNVFNKKFRRKTASAMT